MLADILNIIKFITSQLKNSEVYFKVQEKTESINLKHWINVKNVDAVKALSLN